MDHNKKHFCHLLLYCFDSKETFAELIDSSQKLILSLLHQLKHVNTDFNDSKVMILI